MSDKPVNSDIDFDDLVVRYGEPVAQYLLEEIAKTLSQTIERLATDGDLPDPALIRDYA